MLTEQQRYEDQVLWACGFCHQVECVCEPRFPMVYCSACGNGFGPGNSGFSACVEHAGLSVVED